MLLLGDSLALTLGWSLGTPSLEAKYGYTFQDSPVIGCGVVTGPVAELMGVKQRTAPACFSTTSEPNTTPVPGAPFSSQPVTVQWQSKMAKIHPNVVVLLAGRWEDVDREYEGAWTNILNPTFAGYVKQQLEAASNLVTATGASMVFMTTPCTDEGTQPDGAPWPEDDPARAAVYNELVRQVAAEYPATDSVVDLASVVCPGGKYTTTYKGVTIRRPDGVHFTDPAGIALAPALMPQIVAAGRAHLTRITKKKAG